jgi:plasmid stability protein
MSRVATLHVRNVPEPVYETLRERARLNGRSINAEALAILADVAARGRSATPITDSIRELAGRIELPSDAPRAEEVIREIRDAADSGRRL